MDRAIREGYLASETTYDVVISCKGHKLMAHKVILSIASPVLRDLLLHEVAEPTVLIFPDVNSDIMTHILDYAYTGNVTVQSNAISEFLSVAALLKLHVDPPHVEGLSRLASKESSDEENDYRSCTLNKLKKIQDTVFTESFAVNKCIRKMPSLMPISVLQIGRKRKKELYNSVIPGPWCPREAPLLEDPKKDRLGSLEQNALLHPNLDKRKENDSNNNSRLFPSLPKIDHKYDAILNNDINSNLDCKATDYKNIKSSYFDEQNFLSSYSSIKLKLNKTEDDGVLVENKNKNEETCSGFISVEKIDSQNNTSLDSTESKNETDLTDDEKSVKHKPFKCEDCEKCFSQLRNYKYHRSMHEGTKEFAARCPECGKLFNDRGYLSSHLKIHRDRKEYACPHCPKRFNQRVAYNMHLRIHTGVKPHECPTCGKSFSRKMLLKQHQRVHTGERPYSCPECGKSFADRSNMSLHARLHTGIKPYACNLCPKSFTKKHHLKTHMNFHTGLKPYSCQKCGLAFSQSSNMRTHYKKCILKSEMSSGESQTVS